MSRQLAMKSLRMFVENDDPHDYIKPKSNPVNLKHKTIKRSKNKQGNKIKKKKMLKKNLKYFQKMDEQKQKEISEHQKMLDFLTNKQTSAGTNKLKNNTSEFSDDDMNFEKSILFDNPEEDDEDGEGGFGQWNKSSKKKERQIFQRKK